MRYGFETEIDDSLPYMPLEMRRRLDQAGLKLSLAAWTAAGLAEREALCALARVIEDGADAEARFAAAVRSTGARIEGGVREIARAGRPASWAGREARERVTARVAALGLTLDEAAWEALGDAERYALHHIAGRAGNDDRLRAAWQEFGLLKGPQALPMIER